MVDLFDKRFIVVAGKGGVGRTTVSMILGVCAAKMGKRTLVCLTNAPLRYSELLGGVTLEKGIHKANENLHVVNLNPVSSREEYGLMVLPSRTLHRIVFGSRLVNAFFDAVPGLAQWSMLGKATHHALNETDGVPEYDLVVFDSPATGHGLDILSLPGDSFIFARRENAGGGGATRGDHERPFAVRGDPGDHSRGDAGQRGARAA